MQDGSGRRSLLCLNIKGMAEHFPLASGYVEIKTVIKDLQNVIKYDDIEDDTYKT
ncbi:MAG: hypothetical protein QXG05_02935 [Nitrososphaerota archaeon]